MEFELPLAGGDRAAGADGRPGTRSDVRLGDLAPLLERHLAADDPLRPYAATLRGPLGDQGLRGYLTGSVDVVLRVGDAASPRYLVVDYKTNWLGPLDEPATAGRYAPPALAAAMTHSDYPLQALLYAVVLHRFLRWRQPGYDPATHLGGVLYLYLRGMCGTATPVVDGQPCGVFACAAARRAGRGHVRPAGRRPRRRGRGPDVTELFEPTDAADHRLALRAEGLLAAFNRAGLLTAADTHVAARVGALGGEADETVLLAVALAVRAVRRGSVALDLAAARGPLPPRPPGTRRPRPREPPRPPDLRPPPWPEPTAWARAVRGSVLVDAGVLHHEHGLLYLDRYHRLEAQVADDLARRAAQEPPEVDEDRLAAAVAAVAGEHFSAEQRRAAEHAVRSRTTILTAAPAPGRPRPSPGSCSCWPTRPRPAVSGSRSRSPPPPARPRPGSRRRSRVSSPGCAPATPPRWSTGCRRWRASPSTGSWAGGPTTPPASATTAATGWATTWSSSTSPRWSTSP